MYFYSLGIIKEILKKEKNKNKMVQSYKLKIKKF